MPEFLIFQLYGPLASWGDIATGEYRPSCGHPSKSAVAGIVAAALGIERSAKEEELHIQLNQSLKFAVYVHRDGGTLRDYHTSQVPSSSKRRYPTRKDELHLSSSINTILSQRDYCTDSFYKIALWMKDEKYFSLDQIKKALERPQLFLYLGRKSCPLALPMHPIIVQKKSLKEALDTFSNDDYALFKGVVANNSKAYYWEEGLGKHESGMNHDKIYSRRDKLDSRKRWQFSYREEFSYFEE